MKRFAFFALAVSLFFGATAHAANDITIVPMSHGLFVSLSEINTPDPVFKRFYLESQRAFIVTAPGGSTLYFDENLMPFFKNGMAFTVSKEIYQFVGVNPENGALRYDHVWSFNLGYVHSVVKVNGVFQSAKWSKFGNSFSGQETVELFSENGIDMYWWTIPAN